MCAVMTEGTKYLVTNGFDIFHFAETKEEAANYAAEEVSAGEEMGIFEIKQVGCAYIPEPSVQVEWND